MLRGKIIVAEVNHIIVETEDEFGRKKHIKIGNKYLRFRPEVNDEVTVFKQDDGFKVIKDSKNKMNITKVVTMFMTYIFCFGFLFFALMNIDRLDLNNSTPRTPNQSKVVAQVEDESKTIAEEHIESVNQKLQQNEKNNDKQIEQPVKKEQDNTREIQYKDDGGKEFTVVSGYDKFGTYHFNNCTEVKKVYPEGIPVSHPSFKNKFDRDKDGWGCEN